MDSLISTFHIDTYAILSQVFNFAIIFIALYLFAVKPLSKLMAEREDKIKKGVTDAGLNAEMLANTQKEYDEMIVKAKMEADNILKQVKKDADVKKSEMMEKAKGEVGALIAAGKKSLEAEKIKMVEEAKKEVVSLVMLATEKLLEAKGANLEAQPPKFNS